MKKWTLSSIPLLIKMYVCGIVIIHFTDMKDV